jgi:hypothetical protein
MQPNIIDQLVTIIIIIISNGNIRKHHRFLQK